MTRTSLRTILANAAMNWDKGTADDQRVPQKSLERFLEERAEAAGPTGAPRPGRHKGRRARSRRLMV